MNHHDRELNRQLADRARSLGLRDGIVRRARAAELERPIALERVAVDATPTPEDPSERGVMVALFLSESVARELSVEGGEAAEELHVTLAFLGKNGDLGDRAGELVEVVKSFATQHGPLTGVVSGQGTFTAGPKLVTYASVDLSGLPFFRQQLVALLDAAGFEVSKNHGYTPHITLTYDDVLDGHRVPNVPLEFDSVTVAIAGEKTTFPLTPQEGEQARVVEKGELPHEYVHPIGPDGHAELSPQFNPPCGECSLPDDDLIHQVPVDMNGDGTADDYDTGATLRPNGGVPDAAPASKRPKPLPVTAKLEGDYEAGKVAAGIDAAVDQSLVLLRSTKDLADYPAQARDLLQGIEPACDALLEYFGVSDPDDDNTEKATISVMERPDGPAVDQVISTIGERAFVSEVNGRTLVTGPATVWEKALNANKHMLWMQGRFVGAEKANRNGALWSTQDLEFGEPTVKYGPLNWLHEARHVIGSIADAKLTRQNESAADGVPEPHIVAAAGIWRWIYPDEAFVVEQASDAGKIWFSMECVSNTVVCSGDNGCGVEVPYMEYMRNEGASCRHMRERSALRRFNEPTFLGGAVIVPPVRPGWADADARTITQACDLAEKSYEVAQPNDFTASEWEILMGELVRYADRSI